MSFGLPSFLAVAPMGEAAPTPASGGEGVGAEFEALLAAMAAAAPAPSAEKPRNEEGEDLAHAVSPSVVAEPSAEAVTDPASLGLLTGAMMVQAATPAPEAPVDADIAPAAPAVAAPTPGSDTPDLSAPPAPAMDGKIPGATASGPATAQPIPSAAERPVAEADVAPQPAPSKADTQAKAMAAVAAAGPDHPAQATQPVEQTAPKAAPSTASSSTPVAARTDAAPQATPAPSADAVAAPKASAEAAPEKTAAIAASSAEPAAARAAAAPTAPQQVAIQHTAPAQPAKAIEVTPLRATETVALPAEPTTDAPAPEAPTGAAQTPAEPLRARRDAAVNERPVSIAHTAPSTSTDAASASSVAVPAGGETAAAPARPDHSTPPPPAAAAAVAAAPAADASVEPLTSAPTTPDQTASTARTDAPQSALSRVAIETTAQIAAQIIRKLEGRSTRFEMALTPDDLGRVDVSLEVGADGALAARLAFDNPAAAAELRGRADELRRQLQDAGFQLAQDSLQFAERDASGSGRGFDRRQDRAFSGAARLTAQAEAAAPAPDRWIPLTVSPKGVDLKV